MGTVSGGWREGYLYGWSFNPESINNSIEKNAGRHLFISVPFAGVNSQFSFHTDLSSIFSQSSCPFLVQHASIAVFSRLGCDGWYWDLTQDCNRVCIDNQWSWPLGYISSTTTRLHLVHTGPCRHPYYRLYFIHIKPHLINTLCILQKG
jgi:hypothetical protein